MAAKKMKSALELAMERLDAEAGAPVSLSDEQKAAIADIEQRAQAKLAEMRIMHEKNVAEAGGDYLKVLELEDARKRAVAKIEDATEEDKQAVRDQS